MKTIKKKWGQTAQLDNEGRLWRAEPVKGGFSSRHHHESNDNLFWVVSGRIRVTQFLGVKHGTEEPLTTKQTVCATDGAMIIRAGIQHQFESLDEGTVFMELYRERAGEEFRADDIVRHSEGGIHAS